jgi:hypothetical protein
MIAFGLGAPTWDPNWLYSSAAQAAAALVAIIGGLLVSRLVALSVEREALHRRADELGNEAALLAVRHEKSEQRVRDLAYEWFFTHVLDDYVAHRGNPPDELVDFNSHGSKDEERKRWRAQLSQSVGDAFSAIEGALRSAEITISLEELQKRGVDISRYPTDLVEAVANEIGKTRRPAGLGTWLTGSVVPPISAAMLTGQSRRAEQDANIAARDLLQAQREAVLAQLSLVREHVGRLAAPNGVGWGIAALGGFATLGVVFPLSLMAVKPVPTEGIWRFLVIIAFVVGLSMVLWFIVWLWRSLRWTEPDEQGDAVVKALDRQSDSSS